MSVRHSLLALLAEEPRHGYGLKAQFERSTAGTWPLNVGQVYTTLARLERDGLAEPTDPDGDASGARQSWRITDLGREALGRWFEEPVALDPPARDELAIKVLLAIAADAESVGPILVRQRAAALERMAELTRHKAKADPMRELPWVLVLDALLLKLEAEVRWLDLVAARLAARGQR
ncbi:MAG: PadR family transcriptional regulator [Planctomycetaceae bacterium]|nr:PadR family transcriptional regulator [Planctomycetaceae bacterium]